LELSVRQAVPDDVDLVREILREAAGWLRASGRELWREDELTSSRVAAHVRSGSVFVATCDGDPAATVRLQLSDDLFWPDVPAEEAVYIHRLAVRRRYAGGRLSTALLRWSVDRAERLGRRFVRLDCEHSRTKLRRVYERFGFRWHSDRRVGPFFAARYEYAVGENHA
jgi:GNAT superfamily N-acetyltransferase